MKKRFYSTALLSSFFFVLGVCHSTLSLAGNEGSGGGVATVCRNPVTKEIVSAELLDLYEWPMLHSTKIPKVAKTDDAAHDSELLKAEIQRFLDQPTLKETYNVSLKRMLVKNMAEIARNLDEALARAKNDPDYKDTWVYAQVDIGRGRSVRFKRNCGPEHVVYYNGKDRTLEANPEIYEAFSITDRLALIVHESVYGIRRAFFNDLGSDHSRDDTAMLMAWANTSESYRGFFIDALGEYRGILAAKYINGSAVKVSLSGTENAKIRITLTDSRNPGKKIQSKVFQLSAGQVEEMKLENPQIWTHLEIQVLSAKATKDAVHSNVNFEFYSQGVEHEGASPELENSFVVDATKGSGGKVLGGTVAWSPGLARMGIESSN